MDSHCLPETQIFRLGSLLDNAPNYLVGCVIQKRSRFCTYVSSELPSSVKICFIWPLIQPKVFSWYVTSLSNWHWEPKFPAWHWLILPERFQIKIQYSTIHQNTYNIFALLPCSIWAFCSNPISEVKGICDGWLAYSFTFSNSCGLVFSMEYSCLPSISIS